MNLFLIGAVLLILILFSCGLKLNRDPWEYNYPLGYRSPSSRRNEDTWYEANIYAGKIMMISSVILLVILVLSETLLPGTNVIFPLFGAFVFITFVMIIILTERYLRDVFFSDGKRRPKF